GIHTLSVTVASVVPGDWDTANNGASTSIEVDRDLQMSRSGSAFQRTQTSYNNFEQHYDHASCGLLCLVVHDFYTQVREQISWSYTASLYATSNEEISFPVSQRSSASRLAVPLSTRRRSTICRRRPRSGTRP